MKSFIVEHKKTIAIIGVLIFLISTVSAVLVSRSIQNGGVEDAPYVRDVGVFGADIIIHSAEEGEIVIEPASATNETEELLVATNQTLRISDPEKIWTEDTYAGSHTPTEKARMQDGSLGVLTIDKLGLSVNVFESPDNLEAMTKGVAHFPSTSAWDGLVGFSAHNVNYDGSDGYFKNLYTLSDGDLIQYKTALGERSYKVTKLSTIEASDWTQLYHQDYNMLTLITCISGQPQKRLCVQAIEQSAEVA